MDEELGSLGFGYYPPAGKKHVQCRLSVEETALPQRLAPSASEHHLEQQCPLCWYTDRSPCFKRERTFLSADNESGTGAGPSRLWPYWVLRAAGSLPHEDSAVSRGLGRTVGGLRHVDREKDLLSLIFRTLLMTSLSPRSFGAFLVCGSFTLLNLWLWSFSGIIFREASPDPPSMLSRGPSSLTGPQCQRCGSIFPISFPCCSPWEALSFFLQFTHTFFYCFFSFLSLLIHWVFKMNVVFLVDRFLWFFRFKILDLPWVFCSGDLPPTMMLVTLGGGSLTLPDTSAREREGSRCGQDGSVALGFSCCAWLGGAVTVWRLLVLLGCPFAGLLARKQAALGARSLSALVAFLGCVLFFSKPGISEAEGTPRDLPLSPLVPTPEAQPPFPLPQGFFCVFNAVAAVVRGSGNSRSSSSFLESEISMRLF